jgi:hypothetical protein
MLNVQCSMLNVPDTPEIVDFLALRAYLRNPQATE